MPMGPEEVITRINAAFGHPKGHRTLHAKGRFYDATFTATPEATALTTAEHFNGQPCPVLLRWSNGGGHPKVPDPAPDVRGMAVSFRPANGATTDLLGQTSPRFPARTPEEFVAITEVGAKPITLPLFVLKHPRMAASFPRTLPGLVSPHSFAEATFYPIHAYGWVAADGTRNWVRYRFVPQATKADRLEEKFEGKDRLSEEIRARLGARTSAPRRDDRHRRPRRRPARPDGGLEAPPHHHRRRHRGDRRGGGPGEGRWQGRLRPGARRTRHRAVGGPHPAVPAGRLLGVGGPS